MAALNGRAIGMEVDLKSHKLTPDDASRIAIALEQKWCRVTVLFLPGNKLGDVGVARVAKALAGNVSVTSLDLSCTDMGDVGASSVADLLAGECALKDLRMNLLHRISYKGLSQLENSLKKTSRSCVFT